MHRSIEIADRQAAKLFAHPAVTVSGFSVQPQFGRAGGIERRREISTHVVLLFSGVVGDGEESPLSDDQLVGRAIVADAVGPLVDGQTHAAIGAADQIDAVAIAIQAEDDAVAAAADFQTRRFEPAGDGERSLIVEPDEGRLSLDCPRFESWIADLRTGSAECRRICLLEIEARLRRLALAVPLAQERPNRKSPAILGWRHLSRAEETAAFIAQNHAEPLSAESIGRHVGPHPNYAMALFQQTFGTTLLKYVTQLRLSNAQRLPVSTDELILSIALSSGFTSLSRFNEAFRKSFGCTPREYRRRHRIDSSAAAQSTRRKRASKPPCK